MKLILVLALAAATAAAETHTIRAERYYNSFDHRHAVLARIRPGDTVKTVTIDAGGFDENGKQAGERSNPLTGPFFIEGAEPGDAIAVRFDRDSNESQLRLDRLPAAAAVVERGDD